MSSININSLSTSLSPSATLTVPDENFVTTYGNWTNYDLQTPLAVVKPASEADILAVIRFAASNSLRVSARGGGHSHYNTVAGGIVIDLASYGAVTYEEASQTLTVQGGGKTGEVLTLLAKNNRCAVTGNSNTVGFVPLYLGGGYGPLTPKLGLGIDSAISARLLLSTGEAINASKTENADVFEVICGGGQTLGIVSELKVATYPLAETVGSADGSMWSGTIVYPSGRAADVAGMLETLKITPEMAVYLLISLPPADLGIPLTAPMITFMLGYFGSDADAEAAFKDMYLLEPAMAMAQRVPYAEMNKRGEPYQEPGEFKRHFGIGLNKISAQGLTEVTQQVTELVTKGPEFARSCVLFEMLGAEKLRQSSFGVYPHRSVNYWCLPIVWYKDSANNGVAEQWGVKARDTMKAGDTTEKVAVYSNFRAGVETTEELWGGKENADKIKEMKKRLDPASMFQSLQLL